MSETSADRHDADRGEPPRDEAVFLDEEPVPEKRFSSMAVQLFLFPMLIVTVGVAVYLLFGMLIIEDRSFEDYLNDMRTGGETQRQQTAMDLAMRLSSEGPEFVGGDAVPRIERVIRESGEDDVFLRRFLITAIGQVDDVRAVPILVSHLKDSDEETRMRAVCSLANFSTPAAAAALVASLEDESDAVRATAAGAVAASGDASSVEALRRHANDPDAIVRLNVAGALARFGDERGIATLVDALDRKRLEEYEKLATPKDFEQVLIGIIQSLRHVRDDAVTERVRDLASNDPSIPVRRVALEYLDLVAQSSSSPSPEEARE